MMEERPFSLGARGCYGGFGGFVFGNVPVGVSEELLLILSSGGFVEMRRVVSCLDGFEPEP